ncbi:SdpI family protein [Candidatus Aenigmatarchaeota archaeon]
MMKSVIPAAALIIIAFAISIYVYPSLPEKIPSHWNADGEVDGYMSKDLGIFLMPVFSVFILLLFILLPRIDPLKKNYKTFDKYYEGLMFVIIAFFFYFHILTTLWAINVTFNMTQMIVPAFGILFYYIGSILGKLKQNWFVGIKTPWTLSSKVVWEKTHKRGGVLFRVSGIIALFGIILMDIAIWLLLVPILLSSAYTIVYSYVEYKKLKK